MYFDYCLAYFKVGVVCCEYAHTQAIIRMSRVSISIIRKAGHFIQLVSSYAAFAILGFRCVSMYRRTSSIC